MTKAVVGGALVRVREHFVGLVYLLELPLSITITVMVRMILESKLTESLLHFLVGSVPGDSKDIVVIPLCWHLFSHLINSPLSFEGEGG